MFRANIMIMADITTFRMIMLKEAFAILFFSCLFQASSNLYEILSSGNADVHKRYDLSFINSFVYDGQKCMESNHGQIKWADVVRITKIVGERMADWIVIRA